MNGNKGFEGHNHRPRPIACGKGYRVDACTCGAVHLHCGMASLHLDREQFTELCMTMLSANERLSANGSRLN